MTCYSLTHYLLAHCYNNEPVHRTAVAPHLLKCKSHTHTQSQLRLVLLFSQRDSCMLNAAAAAAAAAARAGRSQRSRRNTFDLAQQLAAAGLEQAGAIIPRAQAPAKPAEKKESSAAAAIKKNTYELVCASIWWQAGSSSHNRYSLHYYL